MTGVSIKMRPPAHLVNKNILMRTESYKRTDIEESWIILDATGKTLGRFASKIADIFSGKNKPEYSPNADLGDYVIVINAGEINVTGKKLDQKLYYKHSGYPGGIKSKPLRKVIEETPIEAVSDDVYFSANSFPLISSL